MKQKPTKKCENGVQLRPASIEEAGLFYSELDQKQDEALGTVGHIRMDFGSGGREFWHTWWPHNEDRFNTLEFKEELQAIVDTLRANGPLKRSGLHEQLLSQKRRDHHRGQQKFWICGRNRPLPLLSPLYPHSG